MSCCPQPRTEGQTGTSDGSVSEKPERRTLVRLMEPDMELLFPRVGVRRRTEKISTVKVVRQVCVPAKPEPPWSKSEIREGIVVDSFE